jgi:hypothetical protein
MSSARSCAWKAKFGGLEVSDAKRLRALEEENGKLKRLLEDTMLDNAGLKDLLSKKCSARGEAGGGRASPDDVGEANYPTDCSTNASRFADVGCGPSPWFSKIMICYASL